MSISIVKNNDVNVISSDFTLDALSTTVQYFDAPANDAKTIILLQNASNANDTVTFKAGNSYAGVNDLAVTVKAGKYHHIELDTALFKNVTGTNAGKIGVVATTGTTIYIKVLEAR